MKINEIISSNYSCFNAIEDARKRGEAINAIKYINSMSSIAGIDISEWDILDMFKREAGMIVSDKLKINQIMFSMKDHKPKYAGMNSSQVRALDRISAKGWNKAAQEFLSAHRSHISRAESFQSSVRAELIEARRAWVKHQAVSGRGEKFSSEVERVVAAGFFKLESVSSEDQEIKFSTINEVTLSYMDVAQASKYSVCLGRFFVIYYASLGVLRVHPHSNNVLSNEYYHPHVSKSGEVCFGEEKHAYLSAMSTGGLGDAMEILQSVLSYYCPDHPYVDLADLKARRDELDAAHADEIERQKQEGFAIDRSGEVIINSGVFNETQEEEGEDEDVGF